MPASQAQVLARHSEIRSALRFFLSSWYKHKQLGSLPSKDQVAADFVRFRSLEAVHAHLRTAAPQLRQKDGRPK